jgi:hypothetical protein
VLGLARSSRPSQPPEIPFALRARSHPRSPLLSPRAPPARAIRASPILAERRRALLGMSLTSASPSIRAPPAGSGAPHLSHLTVSPAQQSGILFSTSGMALGAVVDRRRLLRSWPSSALSSGSMPCCLCRLRHPAVAISLPHLCCETVT